MNVSAPTIASSGTTVCLSVSGAVGPITATVEFANETLDYQIEVNDNGSINICIKVPLDQSGILMISIADDSGSDYEGASVRIIT